VEPSMSLNRKVTVPVGRSRRDDSPIAPNPTAR
jgi:hypothetical protein